MYYQFGWTGKDLAEQSVETVREEDPGVLDSSGEHCRVAGNDLKDLGGGAAVGLRVVGSAGGSIDDCRGAEGGSFWFDGYSLEANTNVVDGGAAIEQHACRRDFLGVALQSSAADWVKTKDGSAHEPGMIGLDCQDAGSSAQIGGGGDERGCTTVGGYAHILKNISADQEVKIVGEWIEGTGDTGNAGQGVEAVVEVKFRFELRQRSLRRCGGR